MDSQFGAAAGSAMAAPDQDPDKDGLSNLIEYALGSDPQSGASSGSPPAVWTEYDTTLAEKVLVFRYRRILANSDLTYGVQSSTALGSWTTVPDTLVSADALYEWREVRLPLSQATRRFLRLQLDLN